MNDCLWVVLPTLNEAENLEAIVSQIQKYIRDSDKILIVDDNSTDGTGEIADRLASEQILVLHRQGPVGLGAAYREGFSFALQKGADFIIQMDADFSHDPADIPRLVAAAKSSDLVLGSRYIKGGRTEGWSLAREVLSRSANIAARLLLFLPQKDLTGGFKCWRRETLLQIPPSTTSGYAFQVEMTHLSRHLTIEEIAIVFRERRAGKSKMHLKIVLEAIPFLLRLRFSRFLSKRQF